MKHNFEVYLEDRLIFYSDGKWLYPLVELEEYLNENAVDPERLLVKDKIVGRAAALILCYLKIKNIHAQTLSQLAKEVLEHYKIDFTYERLIDAINCTTERLLSDEMDPQKGYRLVRERMRTKLVNRQ